MRSGHVYLHSDQPVGVFYAVKSVAYGKAPKSLKTRGNRTNVRSTESNPGDGITAPTPYPCPCPCPSPLTINLRSNYIRSVTPEDPSYDTTRSAAPCGTVPRLSNSGPSVSFISPHYCRYVGMRHSSGFWIFGLVSSVLCLLYRISSLGLRL